MVTISTATVSISPSDFTIMPGEKADVEICVFNSTETIDVFTIEVEGLPDGWGHKSMTSVALFPGDSAASLMTISVPDSPLALGKPYPITVRAISRKYPENSGITRGFLHVDKVFKVEAEKSDDSRSARDDVYSITVKNLGNTSVIYSVVPELSKGRITQDFAANENGSTSWQLECESERFKTYSRSEVLFEPGVFTVGPGDLQNVNVRSYTYLSDRPVIGLRDHYQLEIKVIPEIENGSCAQVTEEVETLPLLNLWLWTFFSFCILGGLIGWILLSSQLFN